MLNSQITSALSQARIADLHRQHVERTQPTDVRGPRAGTTRRSRVQIGLRALRTRQA